MHPTDWIDIAAIFFVTVCNNVTRKIHPTYYDPFNMTYYDALSHDFVRILQRQLQAMHPTYLIGVHILLCNRVQ